MILGVVKLYICLEKVRFKGEKKFLLVKKKEIMYLLILWVLENK